MRTAARGGSSEVRQRTSVWRTRNGAGGVGVCALGGHRADGGLGQGAVAASTPAAGGGAREACAIQTAIACSCAEPIHCAVGLDSPRGRVAVSLSSGSPRGGGCCDHPPLASPAVNPCSRGALAGSGAGERGQRDAVPGSCVTLCGGPHCAPGDCGMSPPESCVHVSRLPHALVGHADDPRRLVVHHDDAVVRACAFPYTTLRSGRRWWMQRDRLAHPLHNVEGPSQSWGVGIILASRREALHLYRLHVLKDLAVSIPHSWLRGHGEGTDRSDSLNVGCSGSRRAASTTGGCSARCR